MSFNLKVTDMLLLRQLSCKIKNFFNINKNQSNSSLGVYNQPEHISGSENLSDERLLIYKSILRKFSTLLFGLEITNMRVLKSRELIFSMKIHLNEPLRVSTSTLPEI